MNDLANATKHTELFDRCADLPTPSELSNLEVGQFIRVLKQCNYFWGQVTHVKPDGAIICTSDDTIPGLKRGAVFTCNTKHVFSIL